MTNMIANMLIKPPVKILATFALVIGLFVGAARFRPGTIAELKGYASNVSEMIAGLPFLRSDGTASDIWSILGDDMALLGIFGTIVARSIVELFAQGGGALIKMMSGGRQDF